jgi:hypothetical protein
VLTFTTLQWVNCLVMIVISILHTVDRFIKLSYSHSGVLFKVILHMDFPYTIDHSMSTVLLLVLVIVGYLYC